MVASGEERRGQDGQARAGAAERQGLAQESAFGTCGLQRVGQELLPDQLVERLVEEVLEGQHVAAHRARSVGEGGAVRPRRTASFFGSAVRTR